MTDAATKTSREHVEALIKKSAEAAVAHEAQAYAQAATNAAHAMGVLKSLEQQDKF